MAKGIKSIKGNTTPEVGKRYFYEVSSYYPGTVVKNENDIKWKLYVKQNNNTWRELRGNPKTGKKVDYMLPEKWLGKTMMIESYMYAPERKTPPALIITPTHAKIPKITKVDLLYVDDTDAKVFSFNEKLRARANCVNMLGKELLFTLWEDDAKYSGHDPKNKIIESKKAKVNQKGVAFAEFNLSKALIKKALEGETDFRQLEFYVTVEYYANKKHATNNINIDTPQGIYTGPPKPKPTPPKEQPKAKNSPAEQKPKSKKEEKGIIEVVQEKAKELWDWVEGTGKAKKDQEPTEIKPDNTKNPTNIEKNDIQKTTVCECEQFRLIWGNKVSCKFRKKVVAIAKELWPEDYKNMANNLMAVFAWETGETFKPDVPNRAGSGATGLIQFIPERAIEYFGKSTMETVPNYFNSTDPKLKNLPRIREFAQMSAEDQLDYVKKYFENLKGKKLEFVDFYLQVLFPVSSGKPEHFVFGKEEHKNKIGLPEDTDKTRQLRIDKYQRNSGMDTFKDGKISKSEIALSIMPFITKGNSEIFIKGQTKKENSTDNTTENADAVVVTDAGHGIAGDPGAHITADTEAIMALEVETETAKNLVNFGIKSIRTRTSALPKQSVDQVTYRANVFKNNKGKIMVSHHLNSSGDKFLIMYHPDKLNKLNNPDKPKEGYKSVSGGSSQGFLKNSKSLGEFIRIELVKIGRVAELRPATVPHTNYSSLGILRGIDSSENAGVLIEMGSVSETNTKFLKAHSKEIGKAIATGIANYLKVEPNESSQNNGECEEGSEIKPVETIQPIVNNEKCLNGICVQFADVVPNPQLNTQGGKNKNRFHGVPRVRIKKVNGKSVTYTYYHGATDILATVGTTIHSLTCGEVVHIRKDLPQNDYKKGYESPTSYGNTIMIKSNVKGVGIVYLFYTHMSQVDVKVGQKISHNDPIGLSGSTGNAMHVDVSVRHVHIEAGTQITATNGLKCNIIKSTRIDAEQFMKTKFDKNGNAIK